jgi:hypothetical protein
MKPQSLWSIAILLSLGLAGCDEGRESPVNTRVSFVHAAPSLGAIGFRREEALEAIPNYRGSSTTVFNVDLYDFHFDVTPAGAEPERLVSFSQELVAGTDYTIIAAEINGQLQQVVLGAPTLDASSTSAQIAWLHLAPMLGPVDLYLAAPGTDPVSTVPLGTLSFTEDLAPGPADAGDYEFILTEAANPAAVVLRSTTFPLSAGQSIQLTIVDGAAEGLAPVAVIVSGDVNVSFVDQNLESSVRVINGIADRSSLDVGVDGDLSPPLISGLNFASTSDYVIVAPGGHNLTASPAGNPSVILLDFPFSVDAGRFATAFIANAPEAATAIVEMDDYRILAGEAKLNLYNAVQLVEFVDIFVTPPGTDLNTIPPTVGLVPGGGSPNIAIAQGSFEITVRTGRTTTVLAGPTPISLDEGGFYGVLLTDSVGGATVDLIFLDNFN